MAEYIPQAPVNDEAKKRNKNLPGMGGVFNYVNMHVYHYAGNNPVKLVDPEGRITITSQTMGKTVGLGITTYTLIPYGGGYTKEQQMANDIVLGLTVAIGVISLFTGKIGLLPTSIASAINALENMDTAEGASVGVGIAVEILKNSKHPITKALGEGLDIANALAPSILEVARNNNLDISLSQATELAKIAIEQSYTKDLRDALSKESGVTVGYPEYEKGGFIMNFKAVDNAYSDTVKRTAERVKASSPVYKDIEINFK